MSMKHLPTMQTIENTKHGGHKDSAISSTMNFELKSFSNNNALQNLLSNFRPDSPFTKQALKLLGINRSEIVQDENDIPGKQNKNNGYSILRADQKNLKLLKTLREIFKKRKELKSEMNKGNPSNIKTIDESPRTIKTYFRKRFYSPQEIRKSEEIDNLCQIDKNFEMVRKKNEKFRGKNQKKIEFYEFLEKRQDSELQKQEKIAQKLEKMKELNVTFWKNQKKNHENARERKKNLIQDRNKDFTESLRALNETITTKEKSFEIFRKQREDERNEKIKIFRLNEGFKKERVDEFQREEEMRIQEQGDSLLKNYEEKVRLCEEKMRQFLRKKIKSSEKKIIKNEKSFDTTFITEEEPRRVRILRRIVGSAKSLENNKRLESLRKREKEKLMELLEESEGKQQKILFNKQKKREEIELKFEQIKIKREENWTNYQRNKRAKVFIFFYLNKYLSLIYNK